MNMGILIASSLQGYCLLYSRLLEIFCIIYVEASHLFIHKYYNKLKHPEHNFIIQPTTNISIIQPPHSFAPSQSLYSSRPSSLLQLYYSFSHLQLTDYFKYKKMQHKNEAKHKLQHYFSVKDNELQKDTLKKGKLNNTKSNNKNKNGKIQNKSSSKNKLISKNVKNNENYNSVNVQGHETSRPKNLFQAELNKKDTYGENRLKRNSSERIIKSKSTGKFNLRVERRTLSPSPIPVKQHPPQEDKIKIVKSQTTRQQKQKKSGNNKGKQDLTRMKRSGSKLAMTSKQQVVERPIVSNRTSNRISVKTEISSKTHSVMRQQDRLKRQNKKGKAFPKKKGKKQQQRLVKYPKNQNKIKAESIIQKSILYSEVSFQDCNGQYPYQSAILSNQKYFLPYPETKSVKTQGCKVEPNHKQQHLANAKRRNSAALNIQKAFRGYITRKYINQAKYIISKVKIIQSWWRKISKAKKAKQIFLKTGRRSIQLIKAKNINEGSFKGQRFNDGQQRYARQKMNMKELIRNILEQNECQFEQSKQLNKTPSYKNKEEYIEVKIKDQILSERKFNSPKNSSPSSFIRTPTNSTFNIKDYFSSNFILSHEKNKIKEIIQSPKMTSPLTLRSPKVVSPHSLNPHFECGFKLAIPQDDYQPFQTNFAAIQQICLYLVDYFKVKEGQMQSFIGRLQDLKYFKSNLVFKYWNSYKLYSNENDEASETFPPPDYEYLQMYEKPTLFPPALREDIINFPQIQIELNNKRFNLQSKMSGPLNNTFLTFIFDALEQAFYQPYKHIALKFGQPLEKNVYKSRKDLFERYLCSALGNLFNWGQVLCGLMSEAYSDQQKIKEERMGVLERRFEEWDLGVSSIVGIKMQVSFLIFEQLVEQLFLQGELL